LLIIMAVLIGVFSYVNLSLAQTDRFGLENAAGIGLAQTDLRIAIINIIRFILGFLGLAAVIIILYGGYLWLTADGNPNKIEKAKKTLISAVIGLIIILSAFIIASFIINALIGALCVGDECPTDTCPVPPCTPTCPVPPCTPNSSNQYAYINKLKDNALSWSRILGYGFTGVAKMPGSATLEVGGYAKNKDSTINGLDLYTALSGETFALQSQFANVPANVAIVDNVYAPWNSSAYAINSEYQAKINALFPNDSHVESHTLKTIVKPLHCFNNIQDEGETGVDCGGDEAVLGDDYCGACEGGTCTTDSDCSTGVCLDGVCAFSPIISSLEPNNGAQGNYITIWGKYFGATPGSVMLTKDGQTSVFANLDLADGCDNTWTDTQIIFEVPEVALQTYNVIVENSVGLTSNPKDFEVNDTVRPGICGVNPESGLNPDPIEIVGNNFPTAPNGQVYWSFKPDNFSSPNVVWLDDNRASDIVPESGVGQTSIRVYNSAEYSNYYNFLISGGGLGEPCGDSNATICSAANICQSGLFCDPNAGCTCQVITNPCTPGSARSCEIPDNTCAATEVCPTSGNWDDAVCTQTDLTCISGLTVEPATQSLYAWAFTFGNGYGFEAPAVIEDCSRIRTCSPDQKLPSPAPWYEGEGAVEGWDSAISRNSSLYIQDPKACVNATVSARFTEKMDVQSVKDHVKFFKCADRGGTNCQAVAGNGNLEVYPTDDGVRDYFILRNPVLEDNAWYKVVLTDGLRSYLNVEMATSTKVIADRFCNVTSYEGNNISNAVYCWNFQTRKSDQYCEPGCPECNPDPKTMNYYYQTQLFSTNVVSEDNVCLMIDPWAYNWGWSSKDISKVTITNNDLYKYDPGTTNRNLTAGSDDKVDPEQTGTARGENYNIAPEFHTKVFSELTQTGQNDYCRVITDFTNPVVMENSSCSFGTIQSPTPWINSKDACRNALIAARFSRDMHDDSLTLNTRTNLRLGSSNTTGNIIVEKCGAGEEFSEAASNCQSIKIAEADSLRIFTYSQAVDFEELLANQSAFGDGTAEGFVIDINAKDLEDPTVDEYLDAKTWYRVVILGGKHGVAGADTNNDGSPDGILLTENSIINEVRNGWDYNHDGQDDYFWVFKTSDQACDVDTVQVSPAENFMEFIGETSGYDAFPQAANCNILARCLFDWTWRSLIELSDNPNETGQVIAAITKLKIQTGICGAVDDNLTDPVQTATAKLDGETNIRAEEPGLKWGYGHLQVGYGDLAVVKYSPNKTTHFEEKNIKIDFNIEAQMDSVRFNNAADHNVNLYQCTDAQAYYKLNDNTNDSSGWQYNGVNKSVSFAAGQFDKAANFTGSAGKYIQIDSDNLKIAGALTVAAWVKPSTAPLGEGRVVFSNYAWNNGGANERGLVLGDDYGAVDHFQFKIFDGSGKTASASTTDFFKNYLNKWTQVVGVYRPGKSVKLYINGEEVASTATALSAISYNADIPTRIGARADSDNQGMWSGSIDEVRLYDQALSASEIKNLYNSDGECPVSGLINKDLTGLAEAGDGALSKVIATSASLNYQVGAQYRLVLKGGPKGLIAWNDNELTNLNFNSTGSGGGEECEPGLYPWQEQAGVCTNEECLLAADQDLCSLANGRLAECRLGSVDCDNKCHNQGNNNQASCGDRTVGPNEDCDDGNIVAGDGCSNRCLNEGSSDKWSSLCFNKILEKGEDCDFGSQSANSANSCSDQCLWKNKTNTGSSANVSVCGNSKKEQGEDCDDGNTVSGDGCRGTENGNKGCLFEGTAGGAVCGNNLVESGQADSFSWTFEAVNDPSVTINMNNCTNGIWQVLVKRGDIDADSIFICEKDQFTGLSENNLWGRIVYKIKSILARFFNIGVLADDNDGCGAGYAVVPPTTAVFSDRLEYLNQDQRVYTYIKNRDWTLDKKYKINVYEGDFDALTNNQPKVSKETTIKEYCQLNDVKVEIWPQGEEKYNDNYFCIGDDCGQNTDSRYDNDISASGNADAQYLIEPTTAYDFPYLKSNGLAVIDDNLEGNQHLYLAWAVNAKDYLIKAEGGFNWELADLPKFDLSTSDFTGTSYKGDQWISLDGYKVAGQVDGSDQLTVTATQQKSGQSALSAEATIDIKIFLCNNPWPTPENFPYQDEEKNCLPDIGITDCPNTNFEIYYCRDNGQAGENDDLPTLATSTVVYQPDPFKKEFLLQRADKSDAIGIRVMANDNHYSPLLWYRENFDLEHQGNPQSALVDGYEAINEGRTVYANAVNVEYMAGSQSLWSDIYLISYSDGADAATQNIYSQMAGYMKFNVGAKDEGGLPFDSNDSGSVCKNNGSYKCWEDSDCAAVDAGACLSAKGKLTRDTKRLGDIQDINWLLNEYYSQKRCSNDKAVVCNSGAQCSGGGTCANYYPDLPAGTYIAGRSFSVWPSWQATLGNALGSALPIDPLNNGVAESKFSSDGYGFDGCSDDSDDFDSVTCWDDINKKMQCPSSARVYTYFSTDNSTNRHVSAFNEFTNGAWNPNWVDVNFIEYYGNPFGLGTNIICRGLLVNCGNNEENEGENCYNCPFDVWCDSGYSCRDADSGIGENWQCTSNLANIDSDTDGLNNEGDNCPFEANANQADTDNDGVGDVCDNCPTVKNANQNDKDSDTIGDACDNCPSAYNPTQDASVCALPSCGNDTVETGEVCDDDNTTNAGKCNYNCAAWTFCGDGLIQMPNGGTTGLNGFNEECDDGDSLSGDGCSNKCEVESGWACSGGNVDGSPSVCSVVVATCGNGVREGAETCDCGTGVGLLPGGASNCGNTSDVYYTTYNILGTVGDAIYESYFGFSASWYQEGKWLPYCKDSCKNGSVVSLFCGDGEWTADREKCDPLTAKGEAFSWGLGTGDNNQWSCTINGSNGSGGCQDTGGWCGDRIINGQEECDGEEGCQSNCSWTVCPPYTVSAITLGDFINGSAALSGVPACNSAEKITADFKIDSTVSKAAIVFVSDLSDSMEDGLNNGVRTPKLTTLKSSLTSAINKIFDEIPDAQIGLVSFADSGSNNVGQQCSDSLCDSSQANILTNIINGYAVDNESYSPGRGTNPADGLAIARPIIKNVSALNKFIVFMSDGAADTGTVCNENDKPSSCDIISTDSSLLCGILDRTRYYYSCSGVPIANTLKSDPINATVYSIAYFTVDAGALSDMNQISSNNVVDSCGTGYCYSSDNTGLNNFYTNIIDNIKDNLKVNFDVTVGGIVTGFSLTIPPVGSANFTSQSITLPADFCTANANNRTIEITSGNFNLSMSNLNLSYCPYHLLANKAGVGSVAGEAAKAADGGAQGFFSAIKNFLFNLFR